MTLTLTASLALLAGLLRIDAARAQPPAQTIGDVSAESAAADTAWSGMEKEMRLLAVTDPRLALQRLQTFYEKQGFKSGAASIEITSLVAQINLQQLGDRKKALEIYKWGIETYAWHPGHDRLVKERLAVEQNTLFPVSPVVLPAPGVLAERVKLPEGVKLPPVAVPAGLGQLPVERLGGGPIAPHPAFNDVPASAVPFSGPPTAAIPLQVRSGQVNSAVSGDPKLVGAIPRVSEPSPVGAPPSVKAPELRRARGESAATPATVAPAFVSASGRPGASNDLPAPILPRTGVGSATPQAVPAPVGDASRVANQAAPVGAAVSGAGTAPRSATLLVPPIEAQSATTSFLGGMPSIPDAGASSLAASSPMPAKIRGAVRPGSAAALTELPASTTDVPATLARSAFWLQLQAAPGQAEALYTTFRLTTADILPLLASAREAPPAQAVARLALASLLVQHGQPLLQDVKKLSAPVRLALADYHAHRKDAQAVALYKGLLEEKELKGDETDAQGLMAPPAFDHLVAYYKDTGELGKAAEMLLGIGKYTRLPEFLGNSAVAAGRLYREAGDERRAEEAYGKVARAGYGWANGLVLYDHAAALIEKNKHEEARKLLMQPVTGPYAEQMKIGMTSLLGYSYFQTQEFEEARMYDQQAVMQYQALPSPLQGEGIQELVNAARSRLILSDKWKNKSFELPLKNVLATRDEKGVYRAAVYVHGLRQQQLTVHFENRDVQLVELTQRSQKRIESGVLVTVYDLAYRIAEHPPQVVAKIMPMGTGQGEETLIIRQADVDGA